MKADSRSWTFGKTVTVMLILVSLIAIGFIAWMLFTPGTLHSAPAPRPSILRHW